MCDSCEKIKNKLKQNITEVKNYLRDLQQGKVGWNIDMHGTIKYYKGYIRACEDMINQIDLCTNKETTEP